MVSYLCSLRTDRLEVEAMHRIKVLLIVLIFLGLVCLKGYSQYADLSGKSVEINGPQNARIIGVAIKEDACDELIIMSRHGGWSNFNRALDSVDVIRIKNHVRAVVMEVKLFEGKAKILLVSGVYQGLTGWIPIEWLDGDQVRPKLARRIPK